MTAGLAVAAIGVGCAGVPQVVSLTRGEGSTASAAPFDASPLEVVTVGAGVRDRFFFLLQRCTGTRFFACLHFGRRTLERKLAGPR